MNSRPSCPCARSARVLFAAAMAQVASHAGLAAGDGEIAAVSSQVSAEYARVKLADGTFQAETYTFGEGGRLAGSG
jgi:hypothetical protein